VWNVSGRVNGALTSAALWVALGIVFLAMTLTALGFLVGGFYLWMTLYMVHAAAAACTAGALMVLAVLFLLVGKAIINRSKKKYPSVGQELRNTIGLSSRMITLLVARDPRKAVIVSLVAGALAEFMTSERRK
jgi:hypothetical protein